MAAEPVTGPAKITRRQKVALVAGSIVVALVLAELGLRTFAPIHLAGFIGVYRYDDELGVTTAPNVDHLRLTDHLQEFVTNAQGTANYSDDFSGFEKVVFTIGDSFTQGTGVSPDASYPFQLDLALNAWNGAYEKNFAVINLGLGSYGMRQEIIAAKRFAGLIRKPEFVLQLGYGNDPEDDVLFASGYHHAHLVQGNPRWFGLGGELGWISERIEIVKRIKLAISLLRRSQIQDTSGEANIAAPPGTAAPTLASRMEAQYRELKALSDEWGAKLIVSWAVCDGALPGEGSYAWLKQWSADNGVQFADWCGTATAVLAAQPRLTMYNPHSGGHYRPWVNRIVAEAFAVQIQNQSPRPDDDATHAQQAEPK